MLIVHLSCGCHGGYHDPRGTFWGGETTCPRHGTVRRVLVADGCPHAGGTYYEHAVISPTGRAVGRTYCSDCGTLLDVAPAETGAPGY